MSPPGVRHIATPPWENDLFVSAPENDVVSVHSLGRGVTLARFTTVLTGEGSRLAIAPAENPLVIAGAWERHGVCAYQLDGTVAWQWKERSQVQRVEVLSESLVAVSYERGPTDVLRTGTGKRVRSLRGVTSVHAVRRDQAVLVSRKSKTMRIADAEQQPVSQPIALVGFAVRAAAGNGELVAISEASGPVRLFEPAGGEHARVEIVDGHASRVAWDPKSRTWIAIAQGVKAELIRFDNDGCELERAPFPSLDRTCIAQAGRCFLCADDSGLYRLDNSDWCSARLTFRDKSQ